MSRRHRAPGRAGIAMLTAGAALALAACGGMMPDHELQKFTSRFGDVEFGMSKTRVQYTMGVPKQRLYSGNQEAWLWCETSNSPRQPDAFMTVYFHKAQVAGIHTYGNRAEGQCETFFRPVEWLADPEKAMAAKVRRRE